MPKYIATSTVVMGIDGKRVTIPAGDTIELTEEKAKGLRLELYAPPRKAAAEKEEKTDK